MNGGGEKEMAQKGIAKQRPERPRLTIKQGLSCQTVCRSGFLHSENQTHQFLGSMRDGNIVVFSLRPLLGEIISKNRVPVADILGCVVKCVA